MSLWLSEHVTDVLCGATGCPLLAFAYRPWGLVPLRCISSSTLLLSVFLLIWLMNNVRTLWLAERASTCCVCRMSIYTMSLTLFMLV